MNIFQKFGFGLVGLLLLGFGTMALMPVLPFVGAPVATASVLKIEYQDTGYKSGYFDVLLEFSSQSGKLRRTIQYYKSEMPRLEVGSEFEILYLESDAKKVVANNPFALWLNPAWMLFLGLGGLGVGLFSKRKSVHS